MDSFLKFILQLFSFLQTGAQLGGERGARAPSCILHFG